MTTVKVSVCRVVVGAAGHVSSAGSAAALSTAVAPAVVPLFGPRAEGSGAEQSEPDPEIRAGC